MRLETLHPSCRCTPKVRILTFSQSSKTRRFALVKFNDNRPEVSAIHAWHLVRFSDPFFSSMACLRSKTTRSFFGPQLGCCRLSDTTRRSNASSVRSGMLCGAWLPSTKALAPPSAKRTSHLWPHLRQPSGARQTAPRSVCCPWGARTRVSNAELIAQFAHGEPAAVG